MPDVQTNMDIRKNPDATVPIFEFTLPKSEVDADMRVGQVGEVRIPVEVVSIVDSAVTFRKTGTASTEITFREPTVNEMRSTMKVAPADEMEESMTKEEK